MTNHYELLYIISGKITEEELQPIIDKVTHLIKEVGGEITRDDNWGKKRFSYPIKHMQQGYYILNEIDLKAPHAKELDKKLRIMPEILRHQIVKIEKRKASVKKPRIKPNKLEKEIKSDIELKPKKTLSSGLPTKLQTESPTANPSAVKKPIHKENPSETNILNKKGSKEKTKTKKVSLEDLDKKIDEILQV